MRIGFLERTLRGRKLTAKAYRHLGFAPSADRTLPAPIKQKKK
jgi:Holliday junction resolvasome RuvABC ATP-dependent DNA helicase subunit